MSELVIRPAHNDHRLIENLLSSSSGIRQMRPLINRLVLDAHVAAKQPAFAQAALDSGTPLLIDPLTFFLQSEVRADDPWRRLPFARATGLTSSELADADLQQELIAGVVEFEIAHGATGVIGPYVLLSDDPVLIRIAQDLLRGTREYMDHHGVELPFVPVLALNSRPRVSGAVFRQTLDTLAHEAIAAEADAVALAISGTGGSDESVDRIHLVLKATDRLASLGLNVIAWRQGLLGPGTVAVGGTGYECGIGTRERCDLVSLQRSRRPGSPRKGFAPPAGVYIQPFGRSIPRKTAQALLDDQKLRPRLVCDSEQCCADGAVTMLKEPRRHAVVARSRQLATLDGMPSRDWKLNAVARDAENAAVIADLATRILHDEGRKETIGSRSLGAMAVAADLIREESDRAAS